MRCTGRLLLLTTGYPRQGLADTGRSPSLKSYRRPAAAASYTHQKIWSEQERFLAAFRTGGTIKAGLENVTVCRRTVELWKQHDTLRFKERFLAAHEEFCDSQEQILYSLNGGLKPGQNPVGLLGTLNANRPEKWHPALKLTHEVPNELIQQLQRLKALGPSTGAKGTGAGRCGRRGADADAVGVKSPN